MNNLALRDKSDQGSGLSLVDANVNNISTLTYYVNVDTRDCIGTSSLQDSILAFELAGGRGLVTGLVINTTGSGISPIVAVLSSTHLLSLKVNDKITITGVQGNTAVNGIQIITSINYTTGQVTLKNTTGNGSFKGSGTFSKAPDTGYPMINEYSSIIKGSEIIVNFGDAPLKDIREINLTYVTIPRDFIPIQVYMIDLVEASTNLVNTQYTSTSTEWSTFIPQEPEYMYERMLGFYSTPIDIFRSYVNGAFSLQDALTPPPLKLWNPPVGAWPKQPLPYPFQTVPTYQSNEFTIPNQPDTFHIVLAGYGVYDFNDWTSNTGVPVNDASITSIARKLLLLLLCPVQSYGGIDYVELILNSNTVDPGNYVSPFGYGDFQRFIPGPGLQLNYQPGTSDNADPTVAGPDWTVPFPDFLGNVWGPYDSPGDRFQKNGLRTVLQDLYLNGDLQNLLGSPIIKPNVPTEDLMSDPTFGLDFSVIINVDLNNITAATNLNILNAMRIMPNGFGVSTVRAMGSGNPLYTKGYQSGGGQGPSSLGAPATWVNTGVYGPGSLDDPIATGPSGSGTTIQNSDPSIPNANITHRISWSDTGTNNGQFITQMQNYVQYTINDIADTDLIMFVEEVMRNERSLGTNNEHANALMVLPMRLNVGSTNGTLQYIDSVYSLVSGSAYWNERFLTPKGKLKSMHISFQTYNGELIDIEKMLQRRKSLQFLQLFAGIINDNIDVLPELTNLNFFFLFNPFDPVLLGRMKRYIQMTFNIDCYSYVLPGLIPDAIGQKRDSLLQSVSSIGPNTPGNQYAIRSDGYSNYS